MGKVSPDSFRSGKMIIRGEFHWNPTCSNDSRLEGKGKKSEFHKYAI